MEILKEKEESEVILKNLDPERGLIIESSDIDYDSFISGTIKAKAYKKAHNPNYIKPSSDLEEMENKYKHPDEMKPAFITIDASENISEDFHEALVSIEEIIEFLDNDEEINV